MSQIEPVGSSHLSDLAIQRVEILDAAVADFLLDYTLENTQRAFDDDWRVWKNYCTEVGIPLHHASIGTLGGFVRWMHTSEGSALATIERRLTGVRSVMKKAGHPIRRETIEEVRKVIKMTERELAEANQTRGRGKAPAITIEHLRKMCAACPDTLAGTRDRSLIVLGFALGARRSEIARLHVSNIVEHDEGLVVTIRRSKTGPRETAVPYGAHLITCPVRSYRAWLTAAEITEGPAFRRIDRHGNILGELTGQGVGIIVTRAAERADLGKRTAHGLRSGMATEARRAGRDAVSIANQGGWSPKSKDLFGYMQVIDRWTDNAVANIGL